MLPAILAVALLVAPDQNPGPLVSASWLAEHLTDPAVMVVQVESRADRYEAAHIPGARFLDAQSILVPGEPDVGVELPPADSLERVLRALGLDDAARIVVVSHSVLTASRLWLTLDHLGHGARASLLDGGIAQWRAEGRALVSGPDEARTAGTFTARPRADMLVDAAWIHGRLDDPSVVLIDARPDDEYTGTDGGMGGMTHAGHIPGARQMYYERLLLSADAPVLRPEAELRALFADAGVAEGRTVVAYCMVGLRASLTYFAARMLGYDVRFYDGSWHDWGTRDLPVVAGPDPR